MELTTTVLATLLAGEARYSPCTPATVDLTPDTAGWALAGGPLVSFLMELGFRRIDLLIEFRFLRTIVPCLVKRDILSNSSWISKSCLTLVLLMPVFFHSVHYTPLLQNVPWTMVENIISYIIDGKLSSFNGWQLHKFLSQHTQRL